MTLCDTQEIELARRRLSVVVLPPDRLVVVKRLEHYQPDRNLLPAIRADFIVWQTFYLRNP